MEEVIISSSFLYYAAERAPQTLFVSRGNQQIQFSYEIPSEMRRKSFLAGIGDIPDMPEFVANLSVTKKSHLQMCLKL